MYRSRSKSLSLAKHFMLCADDFIPHRASHVRPWTAVENTRSAKNVSCYVRSCGRTLMTLIRLWVELPDKLFCHPSLKVVRSRLDRQGSDLMFPAMRDVDNKWSSCSLHRGVRVCKPWQNEMCLLHSMVIILCVFLTRARRRCVFDVLVYVANHR